ncbi:MAG: RsmB/NOP family class I SAM-dependent RNA methyltransferase [Phycisphaerales bacterium]|nr:RsmB/NOP family class I SAM-dependent RNA methyltransferase [Phycisphaerales bacterium]
MTPQRAALAADVVVAWLVDRKSPRDAMAASPLLRDLPAAELAAIGRLATAAIAGMRRHEFVLGGPRGLAGLPPPRRALALVLAVAVATDALLADGAERWFAAVDAPLGFARLLRAEAILAETADPQLRFARRHSVPDWFAARVLAAFGERAEAVATALAQPALRTLRANLLRVADRAALAAELAAEGVATQPARHAPTALHVEGDADLFATAAYRRGAFEQQDEASQLVALLTAPPPRGKVLDACAGSGGKTLALAAALGNRGVVAAADPHAGRLQALRVRARRAGATNLALHEVGETAWPADVAAFAAAADRILIDAPCSGTGSWRRRPEARWLVDEGSLVQLARAQESLLARAAAALRPGARLVYATCSLLPEENADRVAALLTAQPELELVRSAEILGSAVAAPITGPDGAVLSVRPDLQGCDGFFAAVLRRRRAGRV